MNIMDILNEIDSYMREHSNFKERRDYLGISHVSGCPRRAYNNYVNGMELGESTYRMSFAGYEQERSILGMLNGWIRNENMEVVAPFDDRLRGHLDGITEKGDVLEIKSVTVKKFDRVRENNKALPEHFAQCQLYMRYGNFPRALIIYRCRETYEHIVIHIPYLIHAAEKLENKAKSILAAIDAKQPPVCECGYCR